MGSFSNMPLSRKLGLGFGLLIALMLALVLVDNRNMRSMEAQTTRMFKVNQAAASTAQIPSSA